MSIDLDSMEDIARSKFKEALKKRDEAEEDVRVSLGVLQEIRRLNCKKERA